MKLWAKGVKCFLALFVVILFISGCAVQRFKPIEVPVKPKPTLTQEEIKELEQAEIKKADEEAIALAKMESERLAKQPKVSNVFVEADIRSVLMDIATQTGINIIPDETVEGTVSLELKDVPLETALRMVLFPGGYSFRYVKEGNYYIVGSAVPENPSFENLSVTKTIKTNIEAEKVLERLPKYFKPYVAANREKGNIITLSGPPKIVQRIERDIKQIDRPRRQIEIGVNFVVIQWEKGTNLGVSWGDIDLSVASKGSFAKGLEAAYSSDVIAGLMNVVKMRDKKAKVRIEAQPRIVVADGEPAEIKLTEEHLFLIMAGGGAYYSYFTTKEVEVGMKLNVCPFLTRDGEISMKIEPEISDIIGEREFKVGEKTASQKLPIIARRKETTNVKIKNGETVVIGGLLMHTKKETEEGIPILSNFPLLNIFFKGKQKVDKDVELVILITPRVIK